MWTCVCMCMRDGDRRSRETNREKTRNEKNYLLGSKNQG